MRRQWREFSDGSRVTWREAGKGRPLVLLHGWSMSSAVFAELAGLLAPRFRLLLPDLPGHGDSSGGTEASLTGLSDPLTAWLDDVTDGPVLLGGWSLGGMVAMAMAAADPARFERLILIGTTPRFITSTDWPHGLPPARLKGLQRDLRRRFERTLGEFFLLMFAGEDLTRERLAEIRAFAVPRDSLPEPAAARAGLAILADHDQRALLAGLSMPTLVLHGRLDRIVPVAAGRALSARLPRATFQETPDVGHGLFLSRPRQAAEAIGAFC